MIIPTILSGGAGSRLWPRSTADKPKQFLALAEDKTMFAATLARVSGQQGFGTPMIIGNAAHKNLIDDELTEAGCQDATIFLEPCARNTAPAIALAALEADADDVLLVMPSDHVITKPQVFLDTVAAAVQAASNGYLVTFGITPNQPETGYGYIAAAQPLDGIQGGHEVARFVEKPARENAQQMLDQGGHYWNAGIFLMRAGDYIAALQNHAPDIAAKAELAHENAARNGHFVTPDASHFADCPSDSIDYAVMEKAEKVAVFAMDCGWSDLGSWDALYELAAKDGDANAVSGQAALLNSKGNLVQSDQLRIAAADIDNMIIVAQGNDVLILPRGQSQKVKELKALLDTSSKS
ncbi:mannose-1-phosphate guanylyltransferase/mannose-6-phosphate isomerase [Parasphingorhabdus sp. DH2-15]|uniref:mannose-1-phosphate guanylyltransferase/mannose-6-phosphate isomerase n=1 Tax=Parasphingorhabdus sp. DH2-15 TaxID=3444112 RepID=UPI003F6846E6